MTKHSSYSKMIMNKHNKHLLFSTEHDNDNEYDKNVRAINYFINKIETHAYLVQLKNDMNNMMFDDIKSAYEYLDKNSEIFEQMKIVKNNYEYFINNAQAEYIESYRKITGSHSSDKNIINRLIKDFDKSWSKIINHIYHMLCEHVKSYNLKPASHKFIEKL